MTDIADPERALVLAYAPADRRAALATLWRLDERLGDVLRAAHEPLIRAIRLAWWREALEALDTATPPEEPLLIEVADTLLPLGIAGADLAALEAGWAAFADEESSEAALAHGAGRGRPLFTLAARVLGDDSMATIADAGEGWALVAAMPWLDEPARAAAAMRAGACLAPFAGRRWPKRLRALGALTVLARCDLAGAGPRRPGSPRRVARALWLAISGR
ncbi:MAG TPA: squalene/phytoene synthase family protein [Sphingomonadaceae bacterium]|nr:squalene/phytoene synthase family protein [Sphingomonadaceae bacterium]